MSAGVQARGTADARVWDGKRVEMRRRRRRLAAGVLFISVIMILGGAGLYEKSGGLLAACISCPNNPQLCYPVCSPPTISGVTVALQTADSLTRQAWVNWSYAGNGNIAGNFHLSIGSTGAPTPGNFNQSGGKADINLNALNSGTTYTYLIEEGNAAGTTQYTGQFTTLNAPTNEFVGWVSTLVSKPYEADQIGRPIAGATIDSITANCVNPNGAPISVAFPGGGTATGGIYSNPAATTNGAGYYSFAFPLTWVSGGYTYYDLWPNGWCNDNTFGGIGGNVSNPHLALNASHTGYWNATEYLSSANTVVNDYHQFGLPANQQSYSIPGIAFVHTPYSTCGVTIATTITQSISSYNAGSGFTDDTLWTQGASANPASNGESEVDFHQYTTGAVNETTGAVYGEAYAYGPMFDPSQNAVSVTDPESSPPPGQTYPIPDYPGYQVETVGGTGGELFWYNGGTYASTGGLDISVSLTGGWGGASFGPSVELSYTTTTSTSSQTEITCTFTDSGEPAGDYAQFYYNVDGSQAADQDAINVHVWFDDYCVPNQTTCS